MENYIRKTNYEVEYEIDQIEQEMRLQHGLSADWYGDTYSTLLEDKFGNNLKTKMEIAVSKDEYEDAKEEISNNFLRLAEQIKSENY